MDRLDGHHLVVNTYIEECLRQAQAQEVARDKETESDAALRRDHDRTTAACPSEGPAPTPGP